MCNKSILSHPNTPRMPRTMTIIPLRTCLKTRLYLLLLQNIERLWVCKLRIHTSSDQYGNNMYRGRLQGSLETTNSNLLELLDDDDRYKKNGVQKSGITYILYIYTKTHILIRKSCMSFSNVFWYIESVLVNDINNIRLNKWLYLLLKSWHFPLPRFGQNSDDMLLST